MPEMIKNSDGLVAMQHYNTNPRTVKIDRDRTMYSFIPKFNVSMAWIKEEHVSDLLAARGKMCCGKKGNLFYLASQINVNLWMTGDRHGVKAE
jgi:hypothetical protein